MKAHLFKAIDVLGSTTSEPPAGFISVGRLTIRLEGVRRADKSLARSAAMSKALAGILCTAIVLLLLAASTGVALTMSYMSNQLNQRMHQAYQ